MAFASESEYSIWFTKLTPSGVGLAVMVDLQSIWVFAESENQDFSTYLNDMLKSKQIGFKGGKLDATYMQDIACPCVFKAMGWGHCPTATEELLPAFKTSPTMDSTLLVNFYARGVLQ